MSYPINRHEGAELPTSLSHSQSPNAIPPTHSGLQPRYDQPALCCASTSHTSTVSHAHTDLERDVGRDDQRGPVVHGNTDSVYSYNSTRDVSQFVKELHGRIFNTLSETYLLPSDPVEWERLDKQGSALAIAFDGLYPCQDVVDAVLMPMEGQITRILDVGCGTGAWALQMALKFPHASVLGVDLSPTPTDQACFPPNLSLEIDDITLGLSHFAGKMDLVHMRCVSGGIRNMDQTLEDLQQCLKPGGLLLVVDGDTAILKEDRKTVMPLVRLPGDGGPEVTGVSEHGSWFRRVFWEACEACEVAGAGLTRARELYDVGLWDSPLCDPDTAVAGGVDLPIGPWAKSDDPEETQLLQYAGVLMRQNFLSLHTAYHSILLRHGMDQATLDEWSTNVEEELKKMELRMWIRFRFMMARRREGEGLPAPPLPSFPPATEETLSENLAPETAAEALDGQPHKRRTNDLLYPAIDVYYTKEQNSERMRQRHLAIGLFPASVVRKAWASMQAALRD